MKSWKTDPQAARTVDYRPTRCRCGAVIQPHNVVCHSCRRKQNLFFSGLDRLHEKNLDKLLEYHRSEVERHPADFMRLHQLAGVHLLRGEYETARDLYRKVIAMAPDFPDARLNLGGVLAHLGDKDDAVKHLQEFVRLDLHSPRTERVIRAICSIRNIPYEDAMRETSPKEIGTGAAVNVTASGRAKISAPGKPAIRGSIYNNKMPKPVPVVKKRRWGAIDLLLLILIVMAVAGWFLFPAQSKTLISSIIEIVESEYRFTVTSEQPDGIIDDDSASEDDEMAGGNDPETGIINLDPSIDSYFPLAQGYKWEYYTYQSRNPDGLGTRERETVIEMTVDSLVDSEKGLWKVQNGDTSVYYTEKRTGIYAGTSAGGSWSTLFIQLPLPPDDGKTSSTGGQVATVVGTEVLDTAVGKIQCVKVHVTSSLPEGAEYYAWYGRGIGLVRYIGTGRNNIYFIRELKSFDL